MRLSYQHFLMWRVKVSNPDSQKSSWKSKQLSFSDKKIFFNQPQDERIHNANEVTFNITEFIILLLNMESRNNRKEIFNHHAFRITRIKFYSKVNRSTKNNLKKSEKNKTLEESLETLKLRVK
ncbi:CLUMA_CG008093, isoform A [Clunio marinus]|uniref:CLUMA_CG008093, isoform A n=1 Tax=Clunio marinus TaxID=568069 RepID=A0A1J1I860_9DIPT|nr:CLUMA_CG008093, isoform A [Clunio marinus]